MQRDPQNILKHLWARGRRRSSSVIAMYCALFALLLEVGYAQTIVNNGGVISIGAGSVVVGDSLVNTSGTVTNEGQLTLSRSLWNLGSLTGNGRYTLGGNWTNDGGTFTPGTSVVTFNNAVSGQSIDGTAVSQTFHAMVVDKSATALSVGGSTTSLTAGVLTMTSGTFNAASSTLISDSLYANGGTFSVGTSSLTLDSVVTAGGMTLTSATTGTVAYSQSSPGQSVLVADYGNLTFSDFNKILPASDTVAIAGVFTPGSASGHTVTGSTVDFNAAGAQNIPPFSYNNLRLSNSGSKTFAAGTHGIAGALVIAGSATADATSNATTISYNGGGSQTITAISYNGLSLTNAGTKLFPAGTTTLTGDLTIGGTAVADALTNSSEISYLGGGAQAVAAMQYYDLDLSGAGSKTLAADTTRIRRLFSLAGASFDATSNSTTVEFNGTANQTSPAVTYYNLILNNTGGTGQVLTNNVVVANDLSVIDGRLRVTGNNLTVAGTTTISNAIFQLANSVNGVKTLGDVIVSNGGSIDFNVNEDLTINGSLQVNGTGSITSGTGLWSFQDPTSGTIGGSASSVSISNAVFTTDYANSGDFVFATLDISGATLTNNGSLQVTTSLTGTGTITQGGGATLTLSYLGATGISGFSFSAAGNTVDYAAAGAQEILLADYANLSLSGSGTKVFAAGTSRIAGSLAITGATADATSNATVVEYNGGGAQTVASMSYRGLTLANAGVKTFSSGTTNISEGFSITGSASADATTNTPTLVFNGGSVQATPAMTYSGMTVNNASGITIGGNVTVNGTLTLTNGTITTGGSKVSVASTGSVSRTSGRVVGTLEKYVPAGTPSLTFEIGDISAYTPVDIAFANVSTGGTFAAITASGDHAQILTSSIEAAKSANRTWSLTNTGTVFTTYDVVLNFVAGDVDGSATPTSFIVDRYQAGTWTAPTVGTAASTSTQALSVAADGDFQVGELSTSVLKTWDGGGGSNSWKDGLNWNPNGVPTSSNNVSLTGAHTIDIDTAAAANSVSMNNASLVVTIQSGMSLTASGDLQIVAGTLNTAASFPSVTGTVSLSGGTVGYTHTGAQTIAAQSYYHLSLSGSGTKTFSAGTTGISGDLTVTGVTTDATTNSSTIVYGGGGAQSVAAINYHQLTLGNNGTKTFAAGTIGVADTLTINAPATADATANSTTVDFNGSGNQPVPLMNYHHLTLSTGGTKRFAAGTTGIAGNLTVSGATADATTNATTIDYNGGGAQTVGAINYANLTLSNAGTKTFAAGTTGIEGNLTVTGATADATTNTTTIDYNGGGAQAIGAIDYHHLTLSNAGVKTFASGTTGIAGTISITGTASADATSNATLIDYNGSSIQDVGQFDYADLSFSTSGAKRFAAGTTNISGDLLVGGTATVDATTNTSTVVFNGPGAQAVAAGDYSSLTFSVGGTKTLGTGTTRISSVFTVTGAAADLTTNSTTVEFNGSANQISPAVTYYNLISNNTATRLDANNVTVNNDVTVQIGTMRTTGNSLTVTGTMSLNGRWLVTNVNGNKTVGDVVINSGGSIEFTANEVLSINGDLQVNGSGTITSGTGLWTFQAAGGGTLSGSASSVAITNAAFTTNYANSGSFAFGGVTVTGSTFTNNGTVNISGDLTGTGTWTQGSSGSLTYTGTNAITVSGFSVSATGNSVSYDATGAQTIVVADYHNLYLGGTNTKTFGSGTTRISGAFDVTGSAAADGVTNSPTVEFNGTSAQTIHGITYTQVIVNNSAGVDLDGTLTVAQTLTLNSGNVLTGSDTVRIGASGGVSRTSGHIIGYLAKTTGTGSPTLTFEIGDASGNYTPLTTAFASVSASGELTASTTTGDHPEVVSSGIEPSKTANRFWTLGAVGVTFTTYDVTLTFVAGDLDGGANTSAFIVGRYSGSWSLPTVGTRTGTTTQATGIASFGDFAVGEVSLFVLKTWDGGASTQNWTDDANWNPDGAPTSSNNVSLTGANVIDIDGSASVNSITLNHASLVLTILAGNSLTVSGDLQIVAGRLNTEGSFPAVAGTIGLTGGVVGYTASGAQSITSLAYAGLELSGSGTKTFASGTTSLTGDFVVTGVTADATTNSADIVFNGPGAQAIAAIDYHALTLSTGGTKTLAAGTVGVADTLEINSPATMDATTNATTVEFNRSGNQPVPVANYHHVTFTGSGIKQFGAGTTGIAGDVTLSGAAADATTNATLLNYNGGGGQSVAPIDYDDLTFSNAGVKTFASGTSRISGDFVITGSASGDGVSNTTTIEFNGSSSQNIASAPYHNITLSNGSSKILGAGTTTIAGSLTINSGASLDAIANSTTVDFNGTNQTIPAISFYQLNLSNSGTKTLAADTTSVYANLTVGGTASVDAVTNASTVRFTGTLTQNSSPITFYNLLIFKVSNRLTLDGLGVSNNFEIAAGEGRLGAASFTVGGTTTINELFRVASASATPVLGDLVVNSGGTVNFTANAPMTINGDVQVDGSASFTAGTGLWTFQSSGGGILSGTAPALTITNVAFLTDYASNRAMTFSNVTVTGATLTNNSTMTVSGSLDGTGAMTQGASGSLSVTFVGPPTIASINASAAGNLVSYARGGAQAVFATNYFDLTLGTSGVKTLPSDTVGIGNILTIDGTATIDATTNASTVEYNGTGSQNVRSLAYHHLILTTSGSKTFDAGTTQIAGSLEIGGTAVADATTNSTTVEFNGSGAQTIPAVDYFNLVSSNTGSRVLTSSDTIGVAGSFVPGTNAFTVTGSTISYNASGAQSVAAFDYHSLRLDGSGSKTFDADTVRISGDLTIAVAASGTSVPNSTIVEYTGTSAQSVGGMAYFELIFSNGGLKSLGAAATAASTTTITTGATFRIAPAGSLQISADMLNDGIFENEGILSVP